MRRLSPVCVHTAAPIGGVGGMNVCARVCVRVFGEGGGRWGGVAPNLFAADQGSPPPLHFLYLNSNLKRYNYLV